jgi:predicted Zn finger-like uncharacterized protein
MNITCPHCDLNGKISEEKLRASGGKIKCPRCKKTFKPDTIVPAKEVQQPILEEIRLDMNDEDMKFLDDNEVNLEDEEVVVGEEVLEILGEEPLELAEVIEDDVIDEKKKPKEKKKKEKKQKKKKEKKSKEMGAGLDLEIDKIKRVVKERGNMVANSKTGIIGLFLIIFMIIVTYPLISGLNSLYQPFAEEKEFLDDSAVLLGKYRELKTLLMEDIPDPIYIVKINEMAYPYRMYIEKYGIEPKEKAKDDKKNDIVKEEKVKSDDKKGILSEEEAKNVKGIGPPKKQNKRFYDPYYCSLVITGRLFLATKELLVRTLNPEEYLNVEWGNAFPIKTRGQYLAKVNKGLFTCLSLMDDNVEYSKVMFNMSEGYSFFWMMIDRGLRVVGKNDNAKYRSYYSKNLRKYHEGKIKGIDKSLPIVKETFDEIEVFFRELK